MRYGLVCATAITAAAAIGGSASTAVPGPRLVYAAVPSNAASDGIYDAEKAADVFSLRLDGSGRRRLTRTVEWEADPAWSPDGRRLAFSRGATNCHGGTCAGTSEASLWLAYASGAPPRRLTRTADLDGSPTWSPDGRRIAFVREYCCDSSPVDGVYIIGADGRGLRRLLDFRASAVAWSPDGAAIAVVEEFPDGGRSPLHLVDVQTGELSDIDVPGLPRPISLAWSPDGRTLAVVTTAGISLVQPSGGTARPIVSAFYVSGVAWAPDGRRLAFNGSRERWRPRAGKADLYPTDLYLVDVDSRRLQRLTRTAGPEYAPDWRR